MNKMLCCYTPEEVYRAKELQRMADEMVEYFSMDEKEEEDYFEQFRNGNREGDPYDIEVNGTHHIWQSTIYYKYLSGYEIDPRYKFKFTVKLQRRASLCEREL